jgi:hypothetical protein
MFSERSDVGITERSMNVDNRSFEATGEVAPSNFSTDTMKNIGRKR